MRRLLIAMVGLVAALGVGLAPTAAQADEYTDVALGIRLDPAACAGDPLPFTASSPVAGEWTVTYQGGTRTGSGDEIRGTFPTTTEDEGVPHRLTARLVYPGGEVVESTNVVLDLCADQGPATGVRDDAGDAAAGGNGLLPGTGGESLWWLVAALGLVATGTGVVTLRRR